MTEDDIILIVEDDEPIREALDEFLASHHMRAVAYGSAGNDMRAERRDVPACLLLDNGLSDFGGPNLQRRITEGDHSPIVSLTGPGDISSSVRAFKHGAVDCLTRPFSETDLVRLSERLQIPVTHPCRPGGN